MPKRPLRAAKRRRSERAARRVDSRRRREVRSHAASADVRRLHRADQAQGQPARSSCRRRGSAASRSTTCSCAGRPGLGKTTLALILAHEMGVQLVSTSGPVIEHKGALAALLTTKLQKNDILFVDEIHRLNPVVEESLYPALDDSVIDIMTGEGAFASAVQIPLQPFTLVGATTRTGLLTAPLFSRFGHVVRLDFYPPEDLARIVTAQRPAARRRRRRRRGATRSRAVRAARRASPTACCAASATSPRCSGRAASTSRACARRAAGSRSTRRGSTRWTGAYLTRRHRPLRRRSGRGRRARRGARRAARHARGRGRAVPHPAGLPGRTPRGRVANRKAYEALGRPPPPQWGAAGQGGQEGLFE